MNGLMTATRRLYNGNVQRFGQDALPKDALGAVWRLIRDLGVPTDYLGRKPFLPEDGVRMAHLISALPAGEKAKLKAMAQREELSDFATRMAIMTPDAFNWRLLPRHFEEKLIEMLP